MKTTATTRNPLDVAQALTAFTFLELKEALRSRQIAIPAQKHHAIDRLASQLVIDGPVEITTLVRVSK